MAAMNRRLRIALRIGVSAIFTLVCVTLCVYWVRSYQVSDVVSKTEGTGTMTSYGSNNGYLYMMRRYVPGIPSHDWQYVERPRFSVRQFRWISGYAHRRIVVPYWFVVGLAALFVYLPWRRFSLRTLLVAMTVVTLAFGLACYTVE
jgi:hypothetical protein